MGESVTDSMRRVAAVSPLDRPAPQYVTLTDARIGRFSAIGAITRSTGGQLEGLQAKRARDLARVSQAGDQYNDCGNSKLRLVENFAAGQVQGGSLLGLKFGSG